MADSRLEHVNLTVPDPERTAALLTSLFGWHQRWRGQSADGRLVLHIGSDQDYVSLYAAAPGDAPGERGRPLNHIGIVVDDLDAIEAKVAAAGLAPYGHGDYAPGRRFYFDDPSGVEFEIVSYASGSA